METFFTFLDGALKYDCTTYPPEVRALAFGALAYGDAQLSIE